VYGLECSYRQRSWRHPKWATRLNSWRDLRLNLPFTQRLGEVGGQPLLKVIKLNSNAVLGSRVALWIAGDRNPRGKSYGQANQTKFAAVGPYSYVPRSLTLSEQWTGTLDDVARRCRCGNSRGTGKGPPNATEHSGSRLPA
jgi:hypothetical protein